MKTHILVIGGTGFLGSHLFDRLIQVGNSLLIIRKEKQRHERKRRKRRWQPTIIPLIWYISM